MSETAFFVGGAPIGNYRRKISHHISQHHGIYRHRSTSFRNSFHAVLRKWRTETALLSDPLAKTNHDSYKAIVKNLPIVLDLILRELEDTPSILVWALSDGIEEGPDLTGIEGNIEAMSTAWVTWGKQNGKLDDPV